MEKEKFSSTIAGLEEEFTLFKSKHDNMTKYVCILNNGTDMSDEILEIGDKKVISFYYSSMNKNVKVHTKKFVVTEKKYEFLMKDHMFQHPAQHVSPHNKGNINSSWRCHHYGRYDHIKNFRYRLYGYPQPYIQPRHNRRKGKKTQAKKVRRPKETIICIIAHASLRVPSRED